MTLRTLFDDCKGDLAIKAEKIWAAFVSSACIHLEVRLSDDRCILPKLGWITDSSTEWRLNISTDIDTTHDRAPSPDSGILRRNLVVPQHRWLIRRVWQSIPTPAAVQFKKRLNVCHSTDVPALPDL